MLDFNYYENLLRYGDSSSGTGKGIPDFEPTEKDIQKIIKTIKYSSSYEKF